METKVASHRTPAARKKEGWFNQPSVQHCSRRGKKSAHLGPDASPLDERMIKALVLKTAAIPVL